MSINHLKTSDTLKIESGETIEKFTGRLRGFILENEWVLYSKQKEYIDHDWNLNTLIKRNKVSLGSIS